MTCGRLGVVASAVTCTNALDPRVSRQTRPEEVTKARSVCAATLNGPMPRRTRSPRRPRTASWVSPSSGAGHAHVHVGVGSAKCSKPVLDGGRNRLATRCERMACDAPDGRAILDSRRFIDVSCATGPRGGIHRRTWRTAAPRQMKEAQGHGLPGLLQRPRGRERCRRLLEHRSESPRPRAKSDRLDAGQLVTMLLRVDAGDRFDSPDGPTRVWVLGSRRRG